MAWALSGSRARFTGTATSLVGMEALSNVTRTDVGPFRLFVSTRSVYIAGALTIDHNTEMLFVNNQDSNTVEIQSGGTLTLGLAVASGFGNNASTYGYGTSLVIAKNGPGCCSNGALRILSGGALQMYQSTIVLNAVTVVSDGSTWLVRDGVIYSHAGDGNTRIRVQEGAGVDIDGLVIYGIQFDGLQNDAFTRVEGVSGRKRGIPLENAQGTIHGGNPTITWRAVPDPRDFAASFSNNYQGKNNVELINCVAGSATLVVPDNTSGSGHGGRIFHELDATVRDESSVAIENAKMYIIDTNNGSRTTTTTAGTINETANRTYTATTNASGVIPTQKILTGMWYRTNTVGDIGNPDGNEILDFRGKTSGDTFDIRWASYGHGLFTNADVTLRGLDPVNLNVGLLTDPSITQTTKATVDAYSTIDSPQQFYDRAKAYLIDNFAGETALLVTRAGDTITTTLNVVVSDGAIPAFALSGSTITIKSSSFVGNITTTGTVTETAGGEVFGTISDSVSTRTRTTVTVTVVDSAGSPISGARVLLTGGASVNALTNGSGQVTTTVVHTTDTAITGRVRRGTTSPRYVTADISGTLTAAGFSTTATMVLDE